MNEPVILSVVSGKGGVGKTMLSVAIASELAREHHILLLDFDFFNRGLTGLFSSSVERAPKITVDPPDVLGDVGLTDTWYVARVAPNLSVLSFRDMEKALSDRLEMIDSRELSESFRKFIVGACRKADAVVVIIDCCGGPDNTSFAASAIANHTILVSEPDRITLYGTLNFLRRLEKYIPDRKPDIRLVFSKVIPALRPRFLMRFYNAYLRKDFAGHDLLAIYPLEGHLTKAFEITPFLTTVYPTSRLARKTQFLLFDLFHVEAPELVPPEARNAGRLELFFAKYYMGRLPSVFSTDFVFRVVTIVFSVAFVLVEQVGFENKFVSYVVPDMKSLYFIIALGIYWLLVALVVNWTAELDMKFTFSARMRRPIRAALFYLLNLGIYAAVSALCFGSMRRLLFGDSLSLLDISGELLVLGPLVLIVAFPGFFNLKMGVLSICRERRYIEGGSRVAFFALIPVCVFFILSVF